MRNLFAAAAKKVMDNAIGGEAEISIPFSGRSSCVNLNLEEANQVCAAVRWATAAYSNLLKRDKLPDCGDNVPDWCNDAERTEVIWWGSYVSLMSDDPWFPAPYFPFNVVMSIEHVRVGKPYTDAGNYRQQRHDCDSCSCWSPS